MDALKERIVACLKAGNAFPHHECGGCGTNVFYLSDGKDLFFDPTCGCSSYSSPPDRRSWHDLNPMLDGSNGRWPEKFEAWLKEKGY